MATETEETQVSPWYAKFFEYWRNRNRIGPGRVELADCDFFIVGPRRTLRILRPPLKSGWYYENTNERPESMHDNFFARWSRRPHSSGNCRCSFRQSSRLSTTEEQIISDELNRIRTSLCEAEKTGQDIEELEQRVSVNLQKLQVPENKIESASKGGEEDGKTGFVPAKDDQQIDEQKIKNKIVKDLERYINVLLEEILDDTVKYIAGAENTLVKEIKKSKKKSRTNTQEREKPQQEAKEESLKPEKFEAEPFSANEGSLNDISFSFHANNEKRSVEEDNSDATKKESSRKEGYVNRGFIGSENDPDSLDFYLRRSTGTEAPSLEQLDCIDSGINSVETIEFQPEQEPSLEQSLLQIIDEKLGRAPLSNSWEELVDKTNKNVPKDPQNRPSKMVEQRETKDAANSEKTRGAEVSAKNSDVETRLRPVDISSDNLDGADLKELEETANEPSFEKLRLEFKDKEKASSKGKKETTITKLREKFCANLEDSEKSSLKKSWKENEADEKESRTTPIELEDYRKKWPDLEEAVTSSEQNPRDFVMFRKNRKPTIVFLHGFGSSAEIFEHQLRYFSALGYPCIAPDMLGHGMSSAPDRSRDYHFNKLLRDLDAVLHHYAFKPGQKCVVVAHNYGCSFATALASKYVSSIHQLVLISGGGPTPLAPPSTESAGLCCLRAILAPLLMCGLHRDILYSARGRQHPYCGSEPVEQWPSHMKYILDGMIWPEGDYVFHRRICTPTLLIHGLRDNKVSLVHECQMERAMMKAYLEAIPAAGHTPMTDCPEQLNHMIHCFIDLWKNKKW